MLAFLCCTPSCPREGGSREVCFEHFEMEVIFPSGRNSRQVFPVGQHITQRRSRKSQASHPGCIGPPPLGPALQPAPLRHGVSLATFWPNINQCSFLRWLSCRQGSSPVGGRGGAIIYPGVLLGVDTPGAQSRAGNVRSNVY